MQDRCRNEKLYVASGFAASNGCGAVPYAQDVRQIVRTIRSGGRRVVLIQHSEQERGQFGMWAERRCDAIDDDAIRHMRYPRPRYGTTSWGGTQAPSGGVPVCQNTSIGMPPRGYQ